MHRKKEKLKQEDGQFLPHDEHCAVGTSGPKARSGFPCHDFHELIIKTKQMALDIGGEDKVKEIYRFL